MAITYCDQEIKGTLTTTGNITAGGSITLGEDAYGQLNLKDSGTSYGSLYKYGGAFWIKGETTGNTINFGAPTAFVQNINVNGTVDLDNLTVSSAQGTSGQVLTSSGSGVSWQDATSGTVTGSGANTRVAFWDTSSNITGSAGFTFNTTGEILYVNGQMQVKGVGPADYSVAGDTDTGLGGFDGANGCSLVSKGAKQITVKENNIKFDPYTATAVGTGSPAGALNPNQGQQALTQDTLAQLCVDPSGNVVRGEQEGTWTFTRAQLNGTLGLTLISAPGTDKGIIVTESDWMIKFSSTGSAVSGNQTYDIRQANYANASATISTLPGARINEIIGISGTVPNPSYGWVSRDVPLQTRTYKTNVATTLNKKTNDQLPTNVVSISIKLKYRIFDADTF